jgi:hypothetical protein
MREYLDYVAMAVCGFTAYTLVLALTNGIDALAYVIKYGA